MVIMAADQIWHEIYTRSNGVDLAIKLPDDSNILIFLSFEQALSLAAELMQAAARGGHRGANTGSAIVE